MAPVGATTNDLGKKDNFNIRKDEAFKNPNPLTDWLGMNTVPGVLQFGRAYLAGKYWLAVLWAVIIIAFGGIVTYTIVRMSIDYYKYEVIEFRRFVGQDDIPFPAVTVCKNNPLLWSTFKDKISPNLSSAITTAQEMIFDQSVTQGRYLNQFRLVREELFNMLVRYSESERIELGSRKFWIHCGGMTIRRGCGKEGRELLTFNNLFMGNCFTFNPGVSNRSRSVHERWVNMVLLLDEVNDLFPFLVDRTDAIVVMIHEAGSAPTLDAARTNVLYITAGSNLRIGVNTRFIERLPSPHPSKCASDAMTAKKRTQSVYYSYPDRQYEYSQMACRHTCIQKLQIYKKKEPCWHAIIPISDEDLKYVLENDIPMCAETGTVDTQDVIGTVVREKCGCPLKCSSVEHFFESTMVTNWLKSPFNRYYLMGLASKVLLKPFENITDDDLHFVRKRQVFLTVRLNRYNYQHFTEVPRLSTSEFIANIGGIIGFWLGISVVTFVELLQLITVMATRFVWPA